jgi:hypothetical protein
MSCAIWEVNTDKCESILFRPSIRRARFPIPQQYKSFGLKENATGDKDIQHNKLARYLGLWLDERLLFNTHVDTQLNKARKIFFSHSKLFYSKFLNSKVKLICYQALVRPIITYGCQIWYNMGSSMMEKIRMFERKCIRACLGKYRSAKSNYQKYLSNKTIYDLANIPRIDNFIIKLTRDYFVYSAKIFENSLIFPIAFSDSEYIKRSMISGYVPPEAFLYLDENGYIQDKHQVPVIYHVPRHKANKSFTTQSNINSKNDAALLSFNTAIPDKDYKDRSYKKNKKYWWLNK